jgi:signal transduction histidine kinase
MIRPYLDEKLLYSILSNLLLNAIKYSPTGAGISLILGKDSDRIVFQVQDHGIGIAEEDRVDTPRSKETGILGSQRLLA